jgi:cytochrome c peroxidase
MIIGLTVNASAQETTESTAKSIDRVINLPAQPYDYSSTKLPAHFAAAAARFDNTPQGNRITDDGATLGRVLFYDRKLSRNGTTSCATCHRQEFAFAEDRRVSVGFDGKPVSRNSMSLINLRFYPRGRMFWDERAESLEQQVLMPIENELEMGHQLGLLTEQLQSDPIYPPLFVRAFGDAHVTAKRISRALAQFVRSIVSSRSPYDIGRAQVESVHDPFPNFSEQENYGKQMFLGRGNCASCHLEDTDSNGSVGQSAFFFVAAPVVNGIDSDEQDVDVGVAGYTRQAGDRGRFKVSSLRNIELTGPYMHDGRFHTLDQVVEHYNWSVRPHPNLDDRLAEFAANGMALPEREKVALTTFLLTLTDRELLKDPKFSDPFAR